MTDEPKPLMAKHQTKLAGILADASMRAAADVCGPASDEELIFVPVMVLAVFKAQGEPTTDDDGPVTAAKLAMVDVRAPHFMPEAAIKHVLNTLAGVVDKHGIGEHVVAMAENAQGEADGGTVQ